MRSFLNVMAGLLFAIGALCILFALDLASSAGEALGGNAMSRGGILAGALPFLAGVVSLGSGATIFAVLHVAEAVDRGTNAVINEAARAAQRSEQQDQQRKL